MHEKTPVGEIKVVRLPERVALEAKSEIRISRKTMVCSELCSAT